MINTLLEQPVGSLQAIKNNPRRKHKAATAMNSIRKNRRNLSSGAASTSSRASTVFERQMKDLMSGKKLGRQSMLSGVKELTDENIDSDDMMDNSSLDEESLSEKSGLATISAGAMPMGQAAKVSEPASRSSSLTHAQKTEMIGLRRLQNAVNNFGGMLQ